MNWKKLVYRRHYKLVPPALRRMPDGRLKEIDWDWFVSEGADETVTLRGNNVGRGPPDFSLPRDNFHSFQSGHLLLRCELIVTQVGKGFELRPFGNDVRKVTERFLEYIARLVARPQ